MSSDLLTDRTPKNDYSGRVFGKLVVVKPAGYRVANCGRASWWWLCRCDCGQEIVTSSQNLLKNDTRSCGCARRKHGREVNLHHGLSNSGTYRSWRAMKQRCLDNKHVAYNNYGGRGVTICDRWVNSFENFLADMGDRPQGRSLDRIDVNGNYEPGNCRWATFSEQSKNVRARERNSAGQFVGVSFEPVRSVPEADAGLRMEPKAGQTARPTSRSLFDAVS